MARPRVRTAQIARAEVAEIRELFGTVTNAFERLAPPLKWKTFSEAAGGRPARPEDVAALRRSVAEWKRIKLR